MEKYDEVLKTYLLNKTLNDIEFYDSDLNYVSPDMDHTWILDGGIQLKLDNTYFSFAFSSEQEFFNAFSLKIDELNNEFELHSLGARDVNEINTLVGHQIIDIKTLWNFYTELDENFDQKNEKKYMPFEIILYFSNNSFLQIAAIEYEMENNKLINLHYNSERELLISINKKLEIESIE
jgi:hypothetical protein